MLLHCPGEEVHKTFPILEETEEAKDYGIAKTKLTYNKQTLKELLDHSSAMETSESNALWIETTENEITDKLEFKSSDGFVDQHNQET